MNKRITVYAIFPCGDKHDLTETRKPVALFMSREHARQYGRDYWPDQGR